jgi:sugar/nucleoside kinase (ribokinase family)
MKGDGPAAAMKFAAAASAIAVTRLGAAPSIPMRDEVLRFLES